jgi:hypothetical protein
LLVEILIKNQLDINSANFVRFFFQFPGLDAVIDDLKNGRATLRRRPALNNQSSSSNKLNPILREMYELLEKSKQRNRNSKLLVENESISLAYDIQALNI